MGDTTHSLWHADGTDPVNAQTLFLNNSGATLAIFVWDYSFQICIASNAAAPAVGEVQLRIGTLVIDAIRVTLGTTGQVTASRYMNGRGTEYALANGATINIQPSGVNSNFVSYSSAIAIDYVTT